MSLLIHLVLTNYYVVSLSTYLFVRAVKFHLKYYLTSWAYKVRIELGAHSNVSFTL